MDGCERGLECSLTWLGATIGSVSRELGRQEVGNYSTNIGAYYCVLNDINVFHIILKGNVRIKSYIHNNKYHGVEPFFLTIMRLFLYEQPNSFS